MMKKGKGYPTHVKPGPVPMGDPFTGKGGTPEVYGNGQLVGANNEWDKDSYVMPNPIRGTKQNYKGGKIL